MFCWKLASSVSEAVLRFSAPGFSSIDIPVKITPDSGTKPTAQGVGALPPVLLFVLLSFYFYRRFNPKI